MAVEVFANVPTTTVSSGGTDAPASGTQQTWTVASSSGFPAVSSSATPPTQLHIADVALNSEIISVINISGTTWTVIRGAESTTPVSHGAGFTIYQVVSAGAYAQLRSVDWLNVVTQFGADPTGAADSAAAIRAAISGLSSAGGVIYFPTGTYKVSSTLTISTAAVTLLGDGMWSTVINYAGSGDCIRMYTALSYGNGFGGGIKGITIDGTSASAGACGVHAGDIYQLQWDVGVRNFQGTASRGIWFDNQYWWAEDMYGHVWAQKNTQNVVFDNSANLSGNATGSFARTMLDIVLDAKGVGDGVTLLNGAIIYDSRLAIEGNIDYGTAQHYVLNITGAPGYSFTATHASPCVFTAAGSYYPDGTIVTLSGGSLPSGFTAGTGYFVVSASGATFELAVTSGGTPVNSTTTGSGTVQGPYSRIYNSVLDIGVECNDTSHAFQPVTINFGSQGNNQVSRCTGIIDFTAAAAFANAVNWSTSFFFDGICIGDADLKRVTGAASNPYVNGVIGNNALIVTRYTSLGTAAPSGNVTGAILGVNDAGTGTGGGNWANAYFTLVNIGAGSITFDVAGTSNVSTGASCVVPAGNSLTFIWIAFQSLWYPQA